jgi:hypothetical protein
MGEKHNDLGKRGPESTGVKWDTQMVDRRQADEFRLLQRRGDELALHLAVQIAMLPKAFSDGWG